MLKTFYQELRVFSFLGDCVRSYEENQWTVLTKQEFIVFGVVVLT